MTQIVDTKIVRLITGEDIIGTCMIDDEQEVFDIENPFKIIIDQNMKTGKTMMVMLPWLPFEIIEDNFVSINFGDVITTMTPKKMVTEYYNEMTLKFQAMADRLKEEEKASEIDASSDDDSEEYDDQDSLIQDIVEELKNPSSNKLLH